MRRNIGEECAVKVVEQNNRGIFQFRIDFFMTEADREILDADIYDPTGPSIAYSGLLAHYISENCEEDSLASLLV